MMNEHATASEPTRAECFAATCTGARRLGETIGRPVILVDVAASAAASIGELNLARHGAATLWPNGIVPFTAEPGWDDWSLVELPPACETGSAFGARMTGGVIAFEVPAGRTVFDVASQMSAALRSRRLQDLVIQPSWLASRGETSTNEPVHPRYTLSAYDDVRGATLVTDLVALDPVAESARLVWLLVGACLAACDRRRSWWS